MDAHPLLDVASASKHMQTHGPPTGAGFVWFQASSGPPGFHVFAVGVDYSNTTRVANGPCRCVASLGQWENEWVPMMVEAGLFQSRGSERCGLKQRAPVRFKYNLIETILSTWRGLEISFFPPS